MLLYFLDIAFEHANFFGLLFVRAFSRCYRLFVVLLLIGSKEIIELIYCLHWTSVDDGRYGFFVALLIVVIWIHYFKIIVTNHGHFISGGSSRLVSLLINMNNCWQFLLNFMNVWLFIRVLLTPSTICTLTCITSFVEFWLTRRIFCIDEVF